MTPEYIQTFNNILLGVILASVTAMVTITGLIIQILNSTWKARLSILEDQITEFKKLIDEDEEEDDREQKSHRAIIEGYEQRLRDCNTALTLLQTSVSTMKKGETPDVERPT